VKYIGILLVLFEIATSSPKDEFGRFSNYGLYTTHQLEIGTDQLFSMMNLNTNLDQGIYSKGRVLNTMVLISENPNASLDFLFPGVLIMGACFTSQDGDECMSSRISAFINFLNGEIGYKYQLASLSIINEIHPYIFRRFIHDSGLKISYGRFYEYSICLYEQDEFNLKQPTLGIKVELDIFKK